MRIFPLYYLVLALAFVYGGTDVRQHLPWLATYTYNFWLAHQGWLPAHFGHFWSLCVEEQFYLAWPWLIVFVPRRGLSWIVAATVLVAPLFRAVSYAQEVNDLAILVLTPSSFDALGIGALLALAARGSRGKGDMERRLRYSALPIGVVGLAMLSGTHLPAAIFAETMLALILVWLVAGASAGFGGVGRWLLEARPIVYLGKISYGIYVYHLLVPGVFGPWLAALGVSLAPGFAQFTVYALITVAVASASWYLIEHPINRLKNRFATAG